jgi:hypothetical protein
MLLSPSHLLAAAMLLSRVMHLSSVDQQQLTSPAGCASVLGPHNEPHLHQLHHQTSCEGPALDLRPQS